VVRSPRSALSAKTRRSFTGSTRTAPASSRAPVDVTVRSMAMKNNLHETVTDRRRSIILISSCARRREHHLSSRSTNWMVKSRTATTTLVTLDSRGIRENCACWLVSGAATCRGASRGATCSSQNASCGLWWHFTILRPRKKQGRNAISKLSRSLSDA